MSPSTVPTATGVRCGNRRYHGADVVYHANAAAVRECYANTGAFASLAQPAPVARPLQSVLDEHVALVQAERAQKAAATARYAAWRFIPVYGHDRSYHAVEVDGSVQFFRVERPSKGKWAGRTFVKRQAGDSFDQVGWGMASQVLDLIAADPAASSARYGQQIGRCGHCRKTLTDPESIARGLGPDCASRMG